MGNGIGPLNACACNQLTQPLSESDRLGWRFLNFSFELVKAPGFQRGLAAPSQVFFAWFVNEWDD
jgi:hypothetical protein